MNPWADDHADRSPLAPGQLDEIVGGGTSVRVVPAPEEIDRHVGVLVIVLLDVVSVLLPVVVVLAVTQDVQNPALDGGEVAQNGNARLERRAAEPLPDILPLLPHGGLQSRVCLRLR